MLIKTKPVLAFILLLIIFESSAGQKTLNEPELIGTFFRGDFSEFQYHMAQKLLAYDPSTKLVIRICSARSLEDAIATAAGVASSAGQAYEISRMLEKYDISLDRVVLARYRGCVSEERNRFSKVEYWLISSENQLKNEETVGISDVRITYLRSGDTKEDYEKARDSILELKNPSFDRQIYVIGAYDKHPSSQLKRNVSAATRVLTKRTQNAKVKVYFLVSDRIADRDDKEPSYPIFVAVDLRRRRQN